MPDSPQVYLNGEMLPATEAKIPLTDLGLHGVAVTEMTRTFQHECFRLEDHLDRLQFSLESIGIENGPTRDQWRDMTRQVLEQNMSLIADTDDLLINHYLTAGGNPVYGTTSDSKLTICVQAFPLKFSRWAKKYKTGQHLIVPEVHHIPANCIDPRIKSRNRLHWYLADRQARLQDETAAALLLDEEGHLTETSAGNFFIVRNETILTPQRSGTLNGISQLTVIDLAEKLDIELVEHDLTLDEVLNSAEAFTSSTPYCLLPVTRINSAEIGDGKPGAIFHRLMEAWNNLVGIDIIAQATTHSDLKTS